MPGNGEEFGPCPHCGQLHREDVLLCPNTEKLLPLEGRILNRKFRFNKQLGEGGMGAVWKADNVLVKKTVAIKVMHVQFSRDEGVLARFRNEATAAGRIGSKYICDILDLGTSQLGPYIVMEMLKGQDFAGFVQEHAPVDYGTVAMIVRQALTGLEAAHAAGIVHRDLKPENIFLHQPEPGQLLVKLMDFGISKFTEGNDAGKTGMGVLMGTPEYMSPEQTEGAAQVDHRTDIWAMGVILYWALTGKNPFMGPTMAATLMNVSMREAPPLHQIAPGLPPQLVAVVERCIQKNPDQRWSSCTELREALEPFEDLNGRFFVPYASRGASAGGLTRSAPPPGGTVASSGPPPGMMSPQMSSPSPMPQMSSPIGAGPTFSSELGGVAAQGQPTLSGGFSGVGDEDYGRPQSNMGGGIGGIIAIAVVGVALVGGGGYFIWAQATQKDKIAEVTKTPAKSDEGGEGKDDAAEAKADVGEAKKKEDVAAVGAEGAAEAGAAEAGAAEAGAAEAGAAEAGEAEAGAAEAGEAEAGAAEAGEAGAEEAGAEEGGAEGPAEEGGAEEGGAEEGGAEEGGSSPAKKGGSSSGGAKKGSSSSGGAKKGSSSGGAAGGDASGSDKSGSDKSGSDKAGGDKAGGKTAGGKSLTPHKPPRDEKKAGGGDKKAGGEKKKKKGKKAATG